MRLPFDRERMRERNLLDDVADMAQLAKMTPEERFLRGLELSELALGLARASSSGASVFSETLEAKARLWTLRHIGSSR